MNIKWKKLGLITMWIIVIFAFIPIGIAIILNDKWRTKLLSLIDDKWKRKLLGIGRRT